MKKPLSITDNAIPRRADTLNAVLDLESRWTNDINERIDGHVSELVAESIKQEKRHGNIDQASMEYVVDTCIMYRQSNIGRLDRAIREVAVLEYQRVNQIAELLADCC